MEIHVSPDWLLLDTPALDLAGTLEPALAKHAGVTLAEVLRLVPGRVAIRLGGVDSARARRIGEALVRDGAARRVWPGVGRETGVGFFDDRLIVALTPGGGPTPDSLTKAGVEILHATPLPGVFAARARDGDAVRAAWALTGAPGVRYAEPDLLRHVILLQQAGDPDLDAQWHLSAPDDVGDINAPEAWATTTGAPEVLVGIFDTGMDLSHPDLVDNIVGGFDAAGGDDDPSAECSQAQDGLGPAPSCPPQAPFRESHATAVAGLVAARQGNGLFGSGICPDCSLYAVRLLGAQGLRSLSNASAFQRATDEGVWLINNSWGPGLTRFFPLTEAERETFARITREGREGKGVVLVFAAGNDFFTPATANPYAADPGVITVSASTRFDDFACYSNYGSVIAVSGPSRGCFDGETGIATTDVVGQEGYDIGDFTRGFGGTSAAAPVVTGVAALVLAANPALTAQQVRLVLQASARKIRADHNPWMREYGVDLASEFAYDEHGFSTGFGYGRVDAARAVALALAPGLVAGSCDADCPQCHEGRCAPPCESDAECPGASRCLDLAEGARGCALPSVPVDAPGQPCGADCELCVTAFDSQFEPARVCSVRCETDTDCPFGFDCRSLGELAGRACVPGHQECGEPWGSVRCQSEVAVQGGGATYCSCDCLPDTPGACPEGFICKQASCGQIRGGLLCEPARGRFDANYLPTCFPDPDFRRPCEAHRDCDGGLFCVDDVCQADRAPGGCDTCVACTDDAECLDGERCVEVPRGKRCLRACDLDLPPEGQCPGDTVCADVAGPTDEHCVNPDWARKGFCPTQWRCGVEGRCFDDAECGEGVPCVDRQCLSPPAPDAAPPPPPPVDAAVSPDGGGAADAGLGAEGDDQERPASKGSGGCGVPEGSAPSGAGWLMALALLTRRRRRAGSGRRTAEPGR